MSVRTGVIVFPGSNCDHDAFHVASQITGQEARFVWHKETSLGDLDLVIIPGGFSYGDYLRSGAIARFSPIMQAVVKFAKDGGLVLGICNGFQVLCETGLLPGALMRNKSLRFVCRPVHVRVDSVETPFTSDLDVGEVLELPVAHGEGNFYASAEDLETLETEDRVVFRYVDPTGAETSSANPNGSARNIAGIRNAGGNVVGMMPHPERHAEALLGSTDGLRIFGSLARHLQAVPA